ncbi:MULTISPECIES: hypothetical protein [Gordonia]|uniref:Uncharacterized protein n=1 Tax=Gordonia amicalis TaxID=89053 RepID=A0AAE4R125_9ACTN|nr:MULTISPECIES: hypothetical protein [Gordonia]ATD73217.1 hypothetical protein CNO18_18475 [Gordonia sp. 1D]MDJ0451680.1 hypothetical protein [Gordonia amicalis]MDV6306530.1 hypothetical protein [Gordonia amicalis]MDV6311259.1 hypothetical protein [Gordonia amicalis]MDV7075625.1 hypothetical protein [Gordonia amicalis]
MTMTTARPRRVRVLAVAAAVGLALCFGGQAPATAEPSDSGGGSHSVDAPGSGGDSSSGGESGSGDSAGSASGGSGAGGGGDSTGSGSGGTRSGGDSSSGDSGGGSADSTPDPGSSTDSDAGDSPAEPSSSLSENDVVPVDPTPPSETEGSSAGEPSAPPAVEVTEPDPEPSSDPAPNTAVADVDVDIHRNPVPDQPDDADRDGADGTPPPGAERRPGDSPLAARSAGATGSQFDRRVSPSGDPPPWAPMLKTSTPPVAVAPQPYKTGAFGLLTFLGIHILGGGSTGAVSPAPWTLLWWIRRFGTPGPVATAESPLTPYTTGLVTTDPDQFLGSAEGSGTNSPVPQSALVGGLVFGSALLTRKRMAAAVTVTANDPASTIPVPRHTHAKTVAAPAPSGVLHGSLRFTDPDGNPIPTTLHGVTRTSDQTFLTASGSVLAYDASTGTYTYTPGLPARVAAAAPDAPESARFDSVVITAADGRGGTTPITVALPITSPYTLGQVTVPGCQIDDVVIGHDDAAFVTTRRGDGCTQVSVVRPKTMTVATVPIAGSPVEPNRGVVLGPDGRAHQLTELAEIADETLRTSVRVTRVDPSGAASTTRPILGQPADHLLFDGAGVGYLLTTWSDDDGRAYTYLTALDHDGTAFTFPRIPGAGSRLFLSSSGKVFVSTSDADGTSLYEAGLAGLSPIGPVFDGEGGDIWARRGDTLYFVRHHGDHVGRPVATLAIRDLGGSMTTVWEIPGLVSSVVPTDAAVYVVSRSPESVHVTAVRSEGQISTVDLAGTDDGGAVAGPGDHLFLALTDPSTGMSTVVGISPDGVAKMVASGIGQASVRAGESGAVLLTATTTTPAGEDTTTVTLIRGDGIVDDGYVVHGTPVSVHFDRTGAAHIPMLATDPVSGAPLISLAVIRPDATTVVSPPVFGEPAGTPAIAHDGRTYLPLTRFCPQTRRPTTTLVVFHTDGSVVEAGEFHGHSTHGPVISPDGDVILLTHDAGTTTIRPIRTTAHNSHSVENPAPALVFELRPTISAINPKTGAVSGSVAETTGQTCALRYLTTDSQVILDSGSGTFVFTPTSAQRHWTTGSASHDFAVLVSDASGSSTVISVSVPIMPATTLDPLD